MPQSSKKAVRALLIIAIAALALGMLAAAIATVIGYQPGARFTPPV